MYKIGVIGDKSSICGFLAIGIDIFEAYDASEAARLIEKCAQDDYGIIYITEQLASQIPEEIEKRSRDKLPAIIPVPGFGKKTGIGMENVKKSIERAVGSDIISD